MINIAILGYGTVGSGVAATINMNQELINNNAGHQINIKYVLDLHDFKDDPMSDKIVHDYDIILNDPTVRIVVEVMGGIEPAFTFVLKALQNKKHVCTSNKALVAEHGNKLINEARKNNVSFLFEASCGGGIPIIRPLNNALIADKILSITGILNGTTNYILTQMSQNNLSFDTALRQAQELGYAEKDPTNDINGDDARRKLAILSSIAYDKYIYYKDIDMVGIEDIDTFDMSYAKKAKYRIKLIAFSKNNDKISALVAPFFVKESYPLYNVIDVFNAIVVRGNASSDLMFYGSGAGKMPTASAVVSDIVNIAQKIDEHIPLRVDTRTRGEIENTLFKFRFYVRLSGNLKDRKDEALSIFGNKLKFMEIENDSDGFGIITESYDINELKERLSKIDGVLKYIRIFE